MTSVEQALLESLHIEKSGGASDVFDLAALVAEKGTEAATRTVASMLAREIVLLLRIPEDKLELSRPI